MIFKIPVIKLKNLRKKEDETTIPTVTNQPQVIIPKLTTSNLVMPIANTNLNRKNFTLTLDIDSVYGDFSFLLFKNHFKGKLTLNLSTSFTTVGYEEIKTSHIVNEYSGKAVFINSLPHVRLGTCDTKFGALGVYLVLLGSDMQKADFKALIYDKLADAVKASGIKTPSLYFAKTTETVNNSSTKCKISNSNAIEILESVITELEQLGPIIYVEVFGNKTETITTDIDLKNIEAAINDTFEKPLADTLIVDVCISASLGECMITLPNDSFFEMIKMVPNYMPLFSNTIKNLYVTSPNYTTGDSDKLGIKAFQWMKLNFYSTFKYHVDFDNSTNYIMPMSIYLILTKGLFGLVSFRTA